MRKRSLGKALFAGLVSLVSGCSIIEKPDEIRAGFTSRHVQARSLTFNQSRNFTLGSAQISKQVNDKFDLSFGLDFAHTDQDLTLNLDGYTRGDIYIINAEVNYFLFNTDSLSLDFGAEAFKGVISIEARMGPFRYEFEDVIQGGGIYAGATVKLPINDKWGIYLNGKYSFTDNGSNSGNYDGDGFRYGAGLYIRF